MQRETDRRGYNSHRTAKDWIMTVGIIGAGNIGGAFATALGKESKP